MFWWSEGRRGVCWFVLIIVDFRVVFGVECVRRGCGVFVYWVVLVGIEMLLVGLFWSVFCCFFFGGWFGYGKYVVLVLWWVVVGWLGFWGEFNLGRMFMGFGWVGNIILVVFWDGGLVVCGVVVGGIDFVFCGVFVFVWWGGFVFGILVVYIFEIVVSRFDYWFIAG